MTEIKKRVVVRGTLKRVGKSSVKVANIGLKTADHSIAVAERAGKADSRTGAALRKSPARSAASMVKKAATSTGKNAVKTADPTGADSQENTTQYAASHVTTASTATGRKAAKTAARVGNRAVKKTVSNALSGELIPVGKLKTGTKGLKTAATEMKNARTALAAARRSPQAKAMIRRAQKRTFKAGAEMVKAAGRILSAAAKTVGNLLVAFLGAGWILVVISLFIVLAGVGAISSPRETQGELPGSGVSPSEATQVVYYYLRTEMGLNSAAACGVMANIQAESGFWSESLGDSGTSYGICQWHNTRWDRLMDYCVRNGYDYRSLIAQLHFLEWELQNYYPDVWEVLHSAEDDAGGCYDSAAYFCLNFERPAGGEISADERGTNALTIWWEYVAADYTEQGMKLALTAYYENGYNGGYKYWSWYGFDDRVEWCAIFVSWCANQCGYISAGIMPMSCNVDRYENGYQWYDRNATSLSATPDVRPAPGWIVFFSRGHTGIVFGVIDDVVWTIEGNSNDAVRINKYPLETISSSGLWYCVPNYAH